MKARLIQNRNKTFHAYIETEEIYEGVKSEKLSWDEVKKSKITHYLVPASVFERLLELDRKNDSMLKEETNDSDN